MHPARKGKKIGLIGGLSPESTVHYYQKICRVFNKRHGALHFPEISLESISLQRLIGLFENNDWEGVAEILLEALHHLKASGADFAAILANTPHNAYDRIDEKSPLPLVSIMDATSSTLIKHDRKKVALLGTKPTMEYDFFQNHFVKKGITTLVPCESERNRLDRIIWDELSHGIVHTESHDAILAMIHNLEAQGADAVILACTELGLTIQKKDTSLPLFDTLDMHADAILDFAEGQF